MVGDGTTSERHLADLEARVAELESRLGVSPVGSDSAGGGSVAVAAVGGAAGQADRFWVLNGLREQLADADGGVIYAGTLDTANGPVEWQYGYTSEELLTPDDVESTVVAERLAALGSPIRLRLLREVLDGRSSVPELAALDSMGTTGQVYHHVRILTAAGWLRSARRGSLQVPPERVVPLLVALAAAR